MSDLVILDIRSPLDLRMMTRRFRQRRPWMWGPLRHLWLLELRLLEHPLYIHGHYRLKTRADWRYERQQRRQGWCPDEEANRG